MPGIYVDVAVALLGLPPDPAYRPGVVLNLERIALRVPRALESAGVTCGNPAGA